MKLLLIAAVSIAASATPATVQDPTKPETKTESVQPIPTLRPSYNVRIIELIAVGYAREEGQETSTQEFRVSTRRIFGKGDMETWFCSPADAPRGDTATVSWNDSKRRYELDGKCRPQ